MKYKGYIKNIKDAKDNQVVLTVEIRKPNVEEKEENLEREERCLTEELDLSKSLSSDQIKKEKKLGVLKKAEADTDDIREVEDEIKDIKDEIKEKERDIKNYEKDVKDAKTELEAEQEKAKDFRFITGWINITDKE